MSFALNAQAQDVNFVAKFNSDITPLLEVLGKSDLQVMSPGTVLKTYKTSGKLSDSSVAEKAEIPDSNITTGAATKTELVFKKYRNLTSFEQVQKLGYDAAVGATNTDMLKQVQAGVRSEIYTGIKGGTGTASAKADTLQAKCAAAWGAIAVKFDGEAVTPVFFANPIDVADYLATASITTQTAFGLNYIRDFMGLGNLVVDSNVTEGTVIGTAAENITIAAAALTEFAGEMTLDESGIIAVHNGVKFSNAAIETVCYCGIACAPVFADRVVKETYSA